MTITDNTSLICAFQEMIWQFYHTQKRTFPWRHVDDPYKILVSEIMLQQTQTDRVLPKYEQFLETFPTMYTLAQAPLMNVLRVWHGLGYNRRARYLHLTVQELVNHHRACIPNDQQLLASLPGIGKATAASICAFAYNKPVFFIETNIRAAFIHYFFTSHPTAVHDREIMPLVIATVPHDKTREWYYALMDYGVHIKKLVPNPSRKSVHHIKQRRFEGSDRQIRGFIVRTVISHGFVSENFLQSVIQDMRCNNLLEKLIKEGLLMRHLNNTISVP